jgi:nitroimidazol reductase NimA-like FMN-containing flavoprotein (pyridoxamine 5'-phosphate oxidase superfamily)
VERFFGLVENEMQTYEDFTEAYAEGRTISPLNQDFKPIFDKAAVENTLEFYKWLCRQVGNHANSACFMTLFEQGLTEHLDFVLDFIPSTRTMDRHFQLSESDISYYYVILPTRNVVQYLRWVMSRNLNIISIFNKFPEQVLVELLKDPDAYDLLLILTYHLGKDPKIHIPSEWMKVRIECGFSQPQSMVDQCKYLYFERERSPFWLDHIFLHCYSVTSIDWLPFVDELDCKNDFYISKKYSCFILNQTATKPVLLEMCKNGYLLRTLYTDSKVIRALMVNALLIMDIELFTLIHQKMDSKVAYYDAVNLSFCWDVATEEIILLAYKLLGENFNLRSFDVINSIVIEDLDSFMQIKELYSALPDEFDYIVSESLTADSDFTIDLSSFEVGSRTMNSFLNNSEILEYPRACWPRQTALRNYCEEDPTSHKYAIIYLYNNLNPRRLALINYIGIPSSIRLDGETIFVNDKSYMIKEMDYVLEQGTQICSDCKTPLTGSFYASSDDNHGIYYCENCASKHVNAEEVNCLVCMDTDHKLRLSSCSHPYCEPCFEKTRTTFERCVLCKYKLEVKIDIRLIV